MAVVLETTLGDITIDLYTHERPKACLNFLKLCKIKYYNFNLFHTVNQGFIAQTGDPTGTRDGGESIWGVMAGSSKRYFEAENSPRIKHTTTGLVSFVGDKDNMIGSQFFITLAPDLTYLDAQHCVFGEISEGVEILRLLNEAICDTDHRPYKDIRITHTVVLEDPFSDPEGLPVPDASPEPTAERLQGGRIAPDEDVDETEGKTAAEIAEFIAEREAKARATILEMVGDIPDADMAPPENVLFVCKLNPVTTDDDLEIIFSRFGKIKSCEVIRDKKTDDSLQYAFVEFEEQKSCEDAYFKMDNVLIDDRRIHVDFSQSVAKIKWHGKGRGVTHYNEKGEKDSDDPKNDIGNGRYRSSKKQSKDREDSRDRSYERSRDRGNREERKSRSRSRDKYRNGNSSYRHSNYNNYRQVQYRGRRGGGGGGGGGGDRYYRDNRFQPSYNNRYRNDYNDRYRQTNSRGRKNYYRPDSRRRDRYDDRRYRSRSREDSRRSRSGNDRRSSRHRSATPQQLDDRKRDSDKQYKRNKNYDDEYMEEVRDKPIAKPEKKKADVSDLSSAEDQPVKKSKKSKKSKSKKKKHSSSDSGGSDSDSENDRKKSKKKKKKSKKYNSSSASDSNSDVPKKKKLKKIR